MAIRRNYFLSLWESYYSTLKNLPIVFKNGFVLESDGRKYYKLVKLPFPQIEPIDFTIQDLLPRDHISFTRGNNKEKALKQIKPITLEWRSWCEKRLPHFFYHLQKTFEIPDEEVREGHYKVFMRVSQLGNNPQNKKYMTTVQAQSMLKRFKALGILKVTDDVDLNRYCYDEKRRERCFPKGYEVNFPALLKWMEAVATLIFEPFIEKYGENPIEVIKGEGDISRFTHTQLTERMDMAYKNSKKGRINWKAKELVEAGLTPTQWDAILERIWLEEPEEFLQYLEESCTMGMHPLWVLDNLNFCAKIKRRLRAFNADKSDNGVSPHKMSGHVRDGKLSLRIANDLCSIKKSGEVVYKGKTYKDRAEIFKKHLNAVYEYDTKNSIHSDNCYLTTGKKLQGDLYSEILPPRFKEALLKDREWMEAADREVLKPDGTSFDEFFELVVTRNRVKMWCNVLHSSNNRGGKLYNFLFRRFPDNKASKELKAVIKKFCLHFAKVYMDVVGPSLGSFIYLVESYRMLHIANKIMDEKYGCGLVYDCLITEKKLTNDMWDYLNEDALEDFVALNKRYLNQLIKDKGGNFQW